MLQIPLHKIACIIIIIIIIIIMIILEMEPEKSSRSAELLAICILIASFPCW